VLSFSDPNPVRAAVQKYFANLQSTGTPAAADATATRRASSRPNPADMGVRAQPNVAHVTAHGALGGLYSLGESVHNGIADRLHSGPKASDALLAASFVVPELAPLMRGAATAAPDAELAARAFYSSLPAAVQEGRVMSPAVRDKAMGSLMAALPNGGAATGAATAGGMTESQLAEWRGIVKSLGDENAAPRVAPKTSYSPKPAALADPYAGVRPGAESMAIPAHVSTAGPNDAALLDRFHAILTATADAGKYKPDAAAQGAAEMQRRAYSLFAP
jgi:hypothetical protein